MFFKKPESYQNIFKKSFSVLTLSLLGFISGAIFTFSSTPQQARAQFVPVIDPTHIVVSSAHLTAWTGKETVADAAAYIVSQAAQNLLIQQVKNKIINFDGAPAFIRDLEMHLLDLEDKTAGILGGEIISATVCDFYPTYKTELKNTVELSTRKNYDTKFKAKINCTIANPNLFYDDFNAGGWDAWEQMLLNPSGNHPYGTYVTAQEELSVRQGFEQNREEQELVWGDGFRALKDNLTGLVKTPGNVVQQQLNAALSSSLQSITNADELTEILVGFVTVVINDALNGLI